MTNHDAAYYITKLTALVAELEGMDQATKDSRSTVILDQTSVGRLSRMDAMQQQAMANATSQRRQSEILAAKAALSRIDEGEFGYCVECGEDITPKRLDHNPTVATCITCARG
ncbi:TraR/DksA family transcriptional regulator [Amylibacter sp. SFDW26]|uniref:TraR/DksA family transcriptional regulator n=1 Tax=Amylibacter sp. SFDW26 TaxID=2652722 RepID=UPI0012618D60|nr:TraR/DksA family transcriptional regulator [Amylibacter sp. SFDW26]KAB7616068.1 TraR/DksA family transcriptional regulator [Amylibacter sp. SFDW26]